MLSSKTDPLDDYSVSINRPILLVLLRGCRPTVQINRRLCLNDRYLFIARAFLISKNLSKGTSSSKNDCWKFPATYEYFADDYA